MARLLFVGGLGRSGTTLVERLLGELPGVCALGEVVHLWRRDVRADGRCGCGTRFSGCAFWKRVGELAFRGWHKADVYRVLALQTAVERTRHIARLASPRLPDDYRAIVEEYAGYNAAIYRAAAEVSGASLLVDSFKHSALAHCLRWSPEIDLRVAHVVRDPRGFAHSWTKVAARPESRGRGEMTRYSPGRLALLWNAHNAAFGLLARRGVPVRRVRYEQFVADPRGGLRDLAAFAGLRIHDEDLGFLGETHADLSVSPSAAAGNPMRFSVGRIPLKGRAPS